MPARAPQPTRFAIQKARGKGWKTLEVGEDLPHTQARFQVMIGVNPRAFFRLIQLDHNEGSAYEGMEFTWTLIELYDPTKGGVRRPAPRQERTRTARPSGRERVRIPVKAYLAVVLIGLLVGLAVWLRYGVDR